MTDSLITHDGCSSKWLSMSDSSTVQLLFSPGRIPYQYLIVTGLLLKGLDVNHRLCLLEDLRLTQ